MSGQDGRSTAHPIVSKETSSLMFCLGRGGHVRRVRSGNGLRWELRANQGRDLGTTQFMSFVPDELVQPFIDAGQLVAEETALGIVQWKYREFSIQEARNRYLRQEGVREKRKQADGRGGVAFSWDSAGVLSPRNGAAPEKDDQPGGA